MLRRLWEAFLKRIEVDEFWADSTVIEAGSGRFRVKFCYKMDCLFRNIHDLNVLPKTIKQRFQGTYPVRKAFTSDFIREGIKFQVDAIAYKG